ncbi:MAG: hypothetical protein H0Z34_03160 [Brevibacillus sp.]|nr:hypothetical protein [Brevibacillus sp.]
MDAAKKSKIVVLSVVLFSVLIGLFAFWGLRDVQELHKKQIAQVIAERGGEVVQVQVVSPSESPFTESGKGNTIYKITYRTSTGTKIAWYRADNQSSIVKSDEEWKFEDE